MMLERALKERVARPARRLAELASALDALSPLAVLDRGYSLATNADGRLVRDAEELKAGDRVVLRLRSGRAGADVVWSQSDGEDGADPSPAARDRRDTEEEN